MADYQPTYGSGDYEHAPTAPRAGAQDNAYNGQLVPGHDYGASVPRNGELDLTRSLRQGIDAVLNDALTERQMWDADDQGLTDRRQNAQDH
jgi:hypothetical protein